MVRLFQYQPPLHNTHLDPVEYQLFYSSYFKDFKQPIAWSHFSGVSEDGVAFKALLYLPSEL